MSRADRRAVVMGLVVLGVTSLTALVMLVAAAATLFRARRFYLEVIARPFALLLLGLLGVRLTVHRRRPWPAAQTVYISNHTSALESGSFTSMMAVVSSTATPAFGVR